VPGLRDAPQPTVYQPFLQANTGFGGMTLHVRLADAGEALGEVNRFAADFLL
jgi:hypothetical protein